MCETGKPVVGQFVKVIRGRDQEKYAIIIGIVDDRFVWIADGNKRKFDQPKKKNLLHLQLLNEVSREVANSIQESGRVTNSKLRYALNKFVEKQLSEAREKGE